MSLFCPFVYFASYRCPLAWLDVSSDSYLLFLFLFLVCFLFYLRTDVSRSLYSSYTVVKLVNVGRWTLDRRKRTLTTILGEYLRISVERRADAERIDQFVDTRYKLILVTMIDVFTRRQHLFIRRIYVCNCFNLKRSTKSDGKKTAKSQIHGRLWALFNYDIIKGLLRFRDVSPSALFCSFITRKRVQK